MKNNLPALNNPRKEQIGHQHMLTSPSATHQGYSGCEGNRPQETDHGLTSQLPKTDTWIIQVLHMTTVDTIMKYFCTI